MYSSDPSHAGRFYLRLLQTDVTGCKSYDCAKTLPIGTVCEAFRGPAAARGLLYDGRERYLDFEAAAFRATTIALSMIFATIPACCAPGSPRTMWGAFGPHLSEEGSDDAIGESLSQMNEDLRDVGGSLSAFPYTPQLPNVRLSAPETPICRFRNGAAEGIRRYARPLLNAEREEDFQSITSAVYPGAQATHFIDSPLGVGEVVSVRRSFRCRTQ